MHRILSGATYMSWFGCPALRSVPRGNALTSVEVQQDATLVSNVVARRTQPRPDAMRRLNGAR
jgi:hypothetical protein